MKQFFEASYQTVWGWLDDAKVEVAGPGRRDRYVVDLAELLRLVAEGLSAPQIAVRLNAPRRVVWRRVRRVEMPD